MFNDLSSPLALLQSRRSGRPRDLVAPGPDAAALHEILSLAMRVPDHGKLHPWRFVHVPQDRRAAFAELLDTAYRVENPEPGRLELEANERFAHQAPTLIVALSSPTPGHKIPLWEQQLSCGAACFNLELAALAKGYSAGWVTGWAAYSPIVRAAFCKSHERIAGFIFLGTMGAELEERVRPEFDAVASEWAPPDPEHHALFRNALGQASEPDYYAGFLNGILGMIDAAQMAGYDADGIAQLREASEFFESDYRILQHIRAEQAARKPPSDEGGATNLP
jgi:nitroreductase